MPSAGIRKLKSGRYQVWWRLDDYSQGSQSFDTQREAKDYKHDLLNRLSRGTWVDPRRGKISFDEWVTEWWSAWSTDPDRSPTTLEAAESRLRCHLRPQFGRTELRSISVTGVRRWQNELRAKVSYGSVMACRSLLHRILEAAVDDRRIEANPVAKVPPPKRPVDPDVMLGRAKPRVLLPEEFGRLLAALPRDTWDQLVSLAGTGLRAGEFCGLRAARVDLDVRRLEVVGARYDAGRFGHGYRSRPKSTAGIRAVPLAELVAEVIARQLPANYGPDALVFTSADGSPMTRYRLRYLYRSAVAAASLDDLDLHGPHDLRHTFATWLEDEGIPARVIDEVMGHRSGRRGEQHGSQIGRHYRHTTAAMEERVRAVVDKRIGIALEMAEQHAREHRAAGAGGASSSGQTKPRCA